MTDCGCAGTVPLLGGAPLTKQPPRWNKNKVNELTKEDLILWAKKLGIKNYSKMTKAQLLQQVKAARR